MTLVTTGTDHSESSPSEAKSSRRAGRRDTGDVLSTRAGPGRTSRRQGRPVHCLGSPASTLMKLFQVRAHRRKADDWLQSRKSGAADDRAVYKTHRRPRRPPALSVRLACARSPITEAVKQRLRSGARTKSSLRVPDCVQCCRPCWAPSRCEPMRSVSVSLRCP